MKTALALLLGLGLAGVANAADAAAEALIREFGINTQTVNKIDEDVYEPAYGNIQFVTHNCWVAAYNETVVVTTRQIIFIDAGQTCDIWETRVKP